jgi:hypothetical protein
MSSESSWEKRLAGGCELSPLVASQAALHGNVFKSRSCDLKSLKIIFYFFGGKEKSILSYFRFFGQLCAVFGYFWTSALSASKVMKILRWDAMLGCSVEALS